MKKTNGKHGVHDRLIHSIYALVHDESEWPNLLKTMDEFFAQESNTDQPSTRHDQISSLLPHVERANLLLEKIAALNLKSSHTDKVLDHIPMGIVLITAQAKIISKNARAVALLDHIQAKHHEGELCFKDNSQRRAFSTALQEVSTGKSNGTPIRMGDLSLWVSHFGESSSEQLAVYLGHQTFQRNVRIDQLMTQYKLTDREARLTAHLCDGHASLEDAAKRMGINVSTARTHLKKIFAKTGAQRQADLVKMALINPILALQHKDPVLPEKTLASHATLLARLPSGRTLSYAEYGDPKGKPILFCHAITGCRLMLPSNTALLKKKNLRLVVPDRAGYGLSSPATGNSMEQWLEDMQYFMPLVGVPKCCVIGHSAGGAHAMALAAEFPGMIDHLCLISSIAPLLNPADSDHLLPVNRMIISLARSNPVAARAFLKLSLQVALKKPDAYFELIFNSVPDLDKEVLGDARLKRQLLDAFEETARQGIKHLIDEMMYIATEWHVDASRITCPVNIWHGKEDRHAPFPLIQQFSRSLTQCKQTNWME